MRPVSILITAVLALAIAVPATAAPWETRLLVLGNFARKPVMIIDPAVGGLKQVAPPGESRDLRRQAIPVCADTRQYRGVALQIRNQKRFLAGVCQDARDHAVYVVPRGQHWISRNRCADRAYAFVSLTVDRKGVVRCFGYDREPDPEPGTRLD